MLSGTATVGAYTSHTCMCSHACSLVGNVVALGQLHAASALQTGPWAFKLSQPATYLLAVNVQPCPDFLTSQLRCSCRMAAGKNWSCHMRLKAAGGHGPWGAGRGRRYTGKAAAGQERLSAGGQEAGSAGRLWLVCFVPRLARPSCWCWVHRHCTGLYPSLSPGYRLRPCAYLTCQPGRACRHDSPTTFLP